jgi:eukaryotic-like serine/threonine-protein kinase
VLPTNASDRIARVAEVVDRFEGQWRCGPSPAIESFLPATEPERRQVLVELVHVELELRLKAGEPVRLEDYLTRFPELTQDRGVLLALVAAEFGLRRRTEPFLASDEYCQRFPDLNLSFLTQMTPSALSPPGTLVNAPAEAPAGTATVTHPGVAPPPNAVASTVIPPPLARPPAPVTQVGRDSRPASTFTAPGDAPLRPPPAPLPAPPDFAILGELGRGGMGIVYMAQQLSLKRVVALKVMRAGAYADEDQVARFKAEAEAVAQLQHPNVVQVYHVGEFAGRPYCALEYIEGGSLDKRLTGTPLPPRDAAQTVRTLALAIHAAHQRGIVHRDLKPGNVLIAPDGTLKVTDFGLAKRLDNDSRRTQSGVLVGTPSYMAPEQAQGRVSTIGPVTDVYALGAILYELLTGRPPFRGATLWDTVDQVCRQEPVAPSRLQPKLPRDLETICLKCLEKDPRRRYASAAALAGDLERQLANRPVQARPVGPAERAVKWAARQPAAAALIVVSALALLGLGTGGLLYARFQSGQAKLVQQQLQAERVRQRELDSRRSEARDFLARAKGEADKNALAQARGLLERALDRTRGEDALSDLSVEAERLREQVARRQDQEDLRRQAADLHRQFLDRRNDALFHATMSSSGGGLEGSLAVTQKAAREALGLFGVAPPRPAPLDLGRLPFDDRQKRDIREGCYELLLILAETEALTPAPSPEGQKARARAALDLVEAAKGMTDTPTQAYHLRRARYLEMAGDAAGVRAAVHEAEKEPATAALDHYLVGNAHYVQGDLDKALEAFQAALRLEPDHFWAHYFLALCCVRLNRASEAQDHLTSCLGQRPFVWAYLTRGYTRLQLNDLAGAEADFRRAEQARPDADAAYVLHANRSLLRVKQNRPAEAVADLEQAVALAPKRYEAYLTLAQLHQERKEWDRAGQRFRDAIRCEPNLAVLHRFLGRFHLLRDDPAAALDEFQQAIRLGPDTGQPAELARDYAALGQLLRGRGRDLEAVAAYGHALARDPRLFDAYLGRAGAALKLGAYAEVVACVDRYLKNGGPPKAEVYRARGEARARLVQQAPALEDAGRLARYAEILHDFSRAVELEPQHAATRRARGWVYLACDAHNLALIDFQAALNLKDTDAEAYLGRAAARVRLGQARAAAADAEAAVRQGLKTSRLLLAAAQVFSLAVARLATGPAADRSEALLERAHYQDRALDLLRAAADAEPAGRRLAFYRENIQREAALDAVRRSAAFARLRERYGWPAP